MFKPIRNGQASRLALYLAIATLSALCFFLGSAELEGPGTLKVRVQPADAQFFGPTNAWRQVYERLPNFPLENQYVSNETGEIDPDSTLSSRLIRYHTFVKSRPPGYRFDWKLTLADYLGANEAPVVTQYPGGSTLRENPLVGDRAAIAKLSRAEREALIEVLVSIFNPTNSNATVNPTPTASPPPLPSNPSPRPSLLDRETLSYSCLSPSDGTSC